MTIIEKPFDTASAEAVPLSSSTLAALASDNSLCSTGQVKLDVDLGRRSLAKRSLPCEILITSRVLFITDRFSILHLVALILHGSELRIMRFRYRRGRESGMISRDFGDDEFADNSGGGRMFWLNRWKCGLGGWLASGLLVVVLAGCGKETDGPAPAQGTSAPSAEAFAALAKADAADGKTDKVVSKCPTCMLSMDGSPDHAASHGGYTLHLCSEHCKESFEKDPDKALASLEFPEKTE